MSLLFRSAVEATFASHSLPAERQSNVVFNLTGSLEDTKHKRSGMLVVGQAPTSLWKSTAPAFTINRALFWFACRPKGEPGNLTKVR